MDKVRDVKVACLFNVCDLQKQCQASGLKYSEDTNHFLLRYTIQKIGPVMAQKLVKTLVDKGELKWDEDEGYEVETILEHVVDEDEKEYYKIKWKGWAHKYNTWEPKENLDCQDILAKFHEDLQLSKKEPLRGVKRRVLMEEDDKPNKRQRINDIMERLLSAPDLTPLSLLTQSPMKQSFSRIAGLMRNTHRAAQMKQRGNIHNKRTKSYKQLREEVQLALKQWEAQINIINTDPAPIKVENNVDLEGPPARFSYINDYKPMPGVVIPDDPLVGCECTDCFENKKHCCGPNMGCDFAYYKHSRVRVPPGTPIYECNKRCACGPKCPNRVVQHGRRHTVCLFRTHNCRGWGVKALQKVKKGSFVMEYVGEVITNEEAERRGKIYDAEGRTYLFDLDYSDADCPYTVDAGFFGNVSHFVNHSCDPNLAVYGVWCNHLDPHLPRIALFAKRDIKKGEELTFDYLMTGDTRDMLAGEPEKENHPADANTPVHCEEKTDDILDEASAEKPQDRSVESSPFKLPPPDLSSDNTFLHPGVLNGLLINRHKSSGVDDSASDVTDISHMTDMTDTSHAMSDYVAPVMDAPSPFIRRSITSPSPAMKNRIMCQCGSSNCRKYLF